MHAADLRSLIKVIIEETRTNADISSSSAPTMKDVIEQLKTDGFLSEVVNPVKKQCIIYWLRLRGGQAKQFNPFELVSSLDPQGVVSHFSALVFHELTDIRPNAHYLTSPIERPKPKEKTIKNDKELYTVNEEREKRHKTGTLCFTYQDVEFRLRQTYRENIFGHLQIWTDNDEQIQVFNLDRALLDTISDPACNGGIRGVVQAWRNGAEKIREDRLLEYLHKFGKLALWRRAGAMAEYVGRNDIAKMVKEVISNEVFDMSLPLVWNYTEGTVVMPWKVILPW
jgi:predicted transcriptional regulator of viral defense system